MIDKNTRGSEWRKWDLHIHSNASDGNACPDNIIKEAKDKGLSVIALTDHHTVKNIDEIKKLGLEAGITVISGIEFRSEYGSKSVHFIALFPDCYNGVILDSEALHNLILSPLNLSKTTIIAKGREEDSALSEEKAFKKGMFLVQTNFKEAADLIHKYGGLVSVHHGSKANGLDEEVKHKGPSARNTKELYDSLGTLKEDLLNNYVDICEIRKNNDSEDFYLEIFNRPSIVASDAHELNDIGTKYAWIKADPTFEGLKQIIFEPAERVKIQDDKPEQKPNYQVIDSISFDNQDMGKQTIFFNQNLNTIIGGRSSGKSVLLGCIAKAVGVNKEIKRDTYDEYIKNELLDGTVISWKDGNSDTERKIDYFGQSEIYSLAAKSDEVNRIVENIVKMDDEKKKSLDGYESLVILNRTKITNKINEWYLQKEQLNKKNSELKTFGSKSGITNQIKIINDQLENLKKQMPDSIEEKEKQEFDLKKTTLELNARAIRASSENIASLESLEIINLFTPIDSSITSFSEEIQKDVIDFHTELKNKMQEEWQNFINGKIEILEKNKARFKDNSERIKQEDLYKKCKKYYDENIVYTEKEKLLKLEMDKLEKIQKSEKEIKTIENNQEKNQQEILDLHKKYYKELSGIIDNLKTEKDDVKIDATISFKANGFQQRIMEKFHMRNGDGKNYIEFKYQNFEGYEETATKIFQQIDNGKIVIKGNVQQAVIDIFAENYFSLNYNVTYDGDNLDEMSEGKKAFIILRLLLDFDDKDCPILIDQPEDDLDNRAIYDQLVQYLREKKKQRQIILVTHNPNIVVGADAELIIVANQDGVKNKNQDKIKFEYYASSLECSQIKDESKPILISQGIKEHVCEILEGGDEAFFKREKKYGYLHK